MSDPNALAEEWYYALNDERHGPFKRNQMLELIRSGVLGRDVLVWNVELPDWEKAIDALPEVKNTPPPVPAKPPASSPGHLEASYAGHNWSRIIPLQVAGIVCGCFHFLFAFFLTADAEAGLFPIFMGLAIAALIGDCIMHKRPIIARRLVFAGAGLTALILLWLIPSESGPVYVYELGEYVARDYTGLMLLVLILSISQFAIAVVLKKRGGKDSVQGFGL